MPFPLGLLVLAVVALVGVVALVVGSVALSRAMRIGSSLRPKIDSQYPGVNLDSNATEESGSVSLVNASMTTGAHNVVLTLSRKPNSCLVATAGDSANGSDTLVVTLTSIVGNVVTIKLQNSAVVSSGKLFYYILGY